MKHRNVAWAVAIISLVIGLLAIPAFAQEKEVAQGNPAPAVKEEAPQPKDLAIYGEVQNVNTASGAVSVQYYDYDTDEEKTADIIANKDTKIENAATVNDIKKGDWVDVTYDITDGKNVAKFIMVEKEEEASGAGAPGVAPAELPEEE